jgi:hypothetical protein
MSYIGTEDKTVTCIYGTFNIKKNEDVPMLIAVKFPQYVEMVTKKAVHVVVEPPIEEIKLTIETDTIAEPTIEVKNEKRKKEYEK